MLSPLHNLHYKIQVNGNWEDCSVRHWNFVALVYFDPVTTYQMHKNTQTPENISTFNLLSEKERI